MAKILLLETATDCCSVAIGMDGACVSMQEMADCRSHIAVITLMIEACAKEAGIALNELDAVAVSSGPGAYTSLRTGASVAKGLCYASDIPLIAVDTLAALAWGSRAAQPATLGRTVYLPMIDARRAEIWLAAYDDAMACIAPAQSLILEPGVLQQWIDALPLGYVPDKIVMSGSGKKKIIVEDIIKNSDICSVDTCSARFLLDIAQERYKNGQFEEVHSFEPFYMKPPNITVSKKTIL
jgi:tRNA threonylcarbamoyladenosine biosynthesis protein TsaB